MGSQPAAHASTCQTTCTHVISTSRDHTEVTDQSTTTDKVAAFIPVTPIMQQQLAGADRHLYQ